MFPILKAEHDAAAKIDARIDSALKDLNEDLKTIKDAKNIDRHVTSYVARHSFATSLKVYLQLPKSKRICNDATIQQLWNIRSE